MNHIHKQFEFENGYFATAPVSRISKFATHLELFNRVQTLAGDIVECGVFKGNSLMRWIKFRAMKGNAFSKKIIAFDTFDEFPPSSHSIDQKKRLEFIEETGGGKSISVSHLESLLDKQGLNQNLELVPGDIVKTVPLYREKHPELRLSLLHVDVDLYEPTKVILETLAPLVVKGGIIILDDFGSMPGANQAIEESFSDQIISQLPYSHRISFVEKV